MFMRDQPQIGEYAKASPDGLARLYNHTCHDLGGPEFLWDNWCTYVAERNNTTADAVSALHVSAIMENV